MPERFHVLAMGGDGTCPEVRASGISVILASGWRTSITQEIESVTPLQPSHETGSWSASA